MKQLHDLMMAYPLTLTHFFERSRRLFAKKTLAHPKVLEAALIAVPHPRWVERPLACVVPKPGATLDAAEIIDFLRPKLAKWALPDDVAVIEAVPKTSVGKFDKKVLRERFKDRAARGA